jgi:putative nucleotidyltransferase with HDIG domain
MEGCEMEWNSYESLKHLVGCRLKRDIYSKSGVLVLSQSTVLTHDHMRKGILHRVGLTLDDIIIEDERNMNLIMDEALVHLGAIYKQAEDTNRLTYGVIRKKLLPAINQMSENASIFSLLHDLQAKDDYTYNHSFGVAILAVMIGKWMKLNKKELSILTVVALLHDIGKLKIPKEILNKADRLTEEEYAIMKKHTLYGYEIIKNTKGFSYRHALIALQHHEREDGSGYPLGLMGNKLDILSKIVAVADVFHAMTTKRVYRDAIPFHQVLQQMQQHAFGKLDPAITTLFIEKLMSASIGSETMLTDGRRAKIVMINPNCRGNPLVRINSDFVDLSKHGSLNMMRVLG